MWLGFGLHYGLFFDGLGLIPTPSVVDFFKPGQCFTWSWFQCAAGGAHLVQVCRVHELDKVSHSQPEKFTINTLFHTTQPYTTHQNHKLSTIQLFNIHSC